MFSILPKKYLTARLIWNDFALHSHKKSYHNGRTHSKLFYTKLNFIIIRHLMKLRTSFLHSSLPGHCVRIQLAPLLTKKGAFKLFIEHLSKRKHKNIIFDYLHSLLTKGQFISEEFFNSSKKTNGVLFSISTALTIKIGSTKIIKAL